MRTPCHEGTQAAGCSSASRHLRGVVRADPALIRGWTGLPPLGVPSAAWATLLATTLALAWLGWRLARKDHLLALVNRHGAASVAAWGATGQVTAYVQFPAMSIAIAASVFAAQAIGAGRHHQVHEVTRVGLKLNLVLTGSLAVLMALLAPLALRVFTGDAEVVALGAHLLRIAVWGSLLLGIGSVLAATAASATGVSRRDVLECAP